MSGKRSKKLIILAGVLAAACLVTLALLGMVVVGNGLPQFLLL